MKSINVQSSTHAYHIYIGENIRYKVNELLPKKYSAILIITDDTVSDLYLGDVKQSFNKNDQIFETIVPSGEKTKSFDTFYQLQTVALQYGLDRQSLIIALGGGVIGDLAGFVAATFLRGVDYIQIPTTILAHDSSVGGKVAINHELGKNLIGSFYAPQAVIYDVQTLASLPPNEIRSGYAELIKEALISEQVFVQDVLNTKLTKLSATQLQDHITQGIRVKAAIVEADEKEAGERMFLNLGHTLAHALEAELGYGQITHGEAVAIGLLFALKMSIIEFNAPLPYEELLQWLQMNGYPLSLKALDHKQLIGRMKHDKKAINQQIQMVLLKQIGSPTVQQMDVHKLENVLKDFLKELSTL